MRNMNSDEAAYHAERAAEEREIATTPELQGPEWSMDLPETYLDSGFDLAADFPEAGPELEL